MISRTIKLDIALAIIALFFLFFMMTNLGSWLIADDEGTDLYEAWRLQIGETPGQDFFAEQQPLFLITGASILDTFGHSITALRASSAFMVVGGALALAVAVSRIAGHWAAVMSLSLILTSGLVFEQARLFRPDPMMFGWGMAGLGATLIAADRGRRRWWVLAGVLYGMSFLYKPFAVFPIVGVASFLGHSLLSQRRDKSSLFELVEQGIAFMTGFLLVGGAGSLLFYSQTGYYYGEALQQHLAVGQDTTIPWQIRRTVQYYVSLFVVNGVILYLPALWFVNWRARKAISVVERLLLWMLPAPFVLLLISRPIVLRYYIFVIPALAILLALEIDRTVRMLALQRPGVDRARPLILGAVVLFAMFTTRPSPIDLSSRHEEDTLALTNLVIERTGRQDVVLSDYAAVNFHARRPSVYEASIIAHGRITSGIVTGAMLIERLESTRAVMILLHIPGGERRPDHLYFLHDYETFVSYIESNYEHVETFDRQGQLIAVYERRE